MADLNDNFPRIYGQCLKTFSTIQHTLTGYPNGEVEKLVGVLQIERDRLTSWADTVGVNKASVLAVLLRRDLDALQELSLLSKPELSGEELEFPVWNLLQQERAQLLVQQLKNTNNELFNSLPAAQSQQIMEELRLVRLSQLVEIGNLKELLRFQLINSGVDVDTQLPQLTKLKEQRLRLGTATGASNRQYLGKDHDNVWAPQLRKKLLVRKDQPPTATFKSGHREIATYAGDPVFIEWKEYDQESATGWAGMEIFQRVQRLAAMLHTNEHSSLRALRCLGYFEDDSLSRYCLVYSLPSGSSPRKAPMSLLDFIESKWQPSLTSRIELAKDLVTCVLNLHAVGWLHKGLRSENMMFFPKEDGSPRSLRDFHLVGFEYARVQGVDQYSEKLAPNPLVDVYRHPDCLGSNVRFSRKFEYYSLGIILVEIATWSPIHRILQAELPIHRRQVMQSEIEKVRDILLHEKADRRFGTEIEFRMGSKYRKATYTCLSGDFEVEGDEGESGESARKLLEAYATKVVGELSDCIT